MATRKKRKYKKNKFKSKLILEIIILIFAVIGLVTTLYGISSLIVSLTQDEKKVVAQPELDVELLTINSYSRPGIALDEVNGIVIHYTANPGTTAIQNRNYFEGLKDSQETHASSHFIVGIDGEIVQCIPTSEISYASNDRNYDTISIECCYVNEDGSFEDATYDSLVELTAFLIGKFDLTTDDVLRHYDVSGKECPIYFVENEDAWEQFLVDVDAYIEEYGEVVED